MSRITVTFVSNLGLSSKRVSVDVFDTIQDIFECISFSLDNDSKKLDEGSSQNRIICNQIANTNKSLHQINSLQMNEMVPKDRTKSTTNRYIFCFNGKVVDPLMTFHFIGLNKDGRKIFVCKNGRSKIQANSEKFVFNDIQEYRRKIFLSLPENKEKVKDLLKNSSGSINSTAEKEEKNHLIIDDISNLFSNNEKTHEVDLQFDDFDFRHDDFNERLRKQKVNEILKINDQIWATWETSKTHSKVIRYMMKKIEQQKEEDMNENSGLTLSDDRKSSENPKGNFSSSGLNLCPEENAHYMLKQKHFECSLNLEKATEISCKPLPNCFGRRSMNSHAILMAEYPPSTDCDSTSTAQNFDLD